MAEKSTQDARQGASEPVALSSSLAAAGRRFPQPVTARTLVRELLATHAYGGHSPGSPRLGPEPPDPEHRTAADWYAQVGGLYGEGPDAILDGRAVVAGLALLDAELFRELSADGFLDEVRRELGRPLTPAAAELWRHRAARGETMPTLDDAPAEVDDLGRAILAEILALRIRKIREKGPRWVSKAHVRWRRLVRFARRRHGEAELPRDGWDGRRGRGFLIHVDGAWGAGKSSFLNFLARDLRGRPDDPPERRWLVVEFNAWAHQRIVPPWWWLLTAVHRDARRGLWGLDRRRALLLAGLEGWWRIRDGWASYLLLPIGLAAAILLYREGFFGDGLSGASETAKSLAAIVAFAVSVWAGVRSLNRWLLTGSPNPAANLLERSRDPMGLVTERFARVVHVARYPIAILVDDLDRCEADYAVKLLEGIQTLFVNEPVTYIVAADGDWLRACYRQVYAPFCDDAHEPGRPLGALFLEKTFQETVRMPRLPTTTRARYWRRLLADAPPAAAARNAGARDEAAGLFAGQGDDSSTLSVLRAAEQAGRIDPFELRRAAALHLESQGVEQATRYALEEFDDLLEDNPRAMKKLVNAYGIKRHLLVLEGETTVTEEDDLRRLALWTILTLRWPLLARHLEDAPELVALAVAPGGVGELNGDASAELVRLFAADPVRAVIEGRGIGVGLRPQDVARFAGR